MLFFLESLKPQETQPQEPQAVLEKHTTETKALGRCAATQPSRATKATTTQRERCCTYIHRPECTHFMWLISAAPLTLGVVCTPAAADRLAASPAAPPAPTATIMGFPPPAAAAAPTSPLPIARPDCPPAAAAAAPSRTAVLSTASDMTVAVELSMTEEEEGELAGEGSGYW